MTTPIKIIFLTLICIVCGCSRKQADNIVALDLKIKSEAKSVKIDTVGFFENLIYARRFFVYQDSVLIVQNRKHDGYFVEIYNLKDEQLLSEFFRLGNGPVEMLSANATLQDNILTVNDYEKNQVAFLNIDSVLHNSQYSTKIIRHYCNAPTVVRYTSDSLLFENPNCFKNKELRIDQKAPRFITTSEKVPYVENISYTYYTRNVATDGNIIQNFTKDRIIYAAFHEPNIEIYTKNLTLIKQIKGPDKLPIQYVIEEANTVTFHKKIPYTYMNFSANADFVYLTYIGDFLVPSQHQKMEDLHSWIFKFDWDGNFIESYNSARYLASISLSKDGKSLYATAINEEGNPYLIKISLNEK